MKNHAATKIDKLPVIKRRIIHCASVCREVVGETEDYYEHHDVDASNRVHDVPQYPPSSRMGPE